MTAEEFFRNKIKALNPGKEVVTLHREIIDGEMAMRWAHEYSSSQTADLKKEVETLRLENEKYKNATNNSKD